MDTLLEAIIASPLLPRHVERLNQILAEERPRRERFYEEMTAEGKWEFINGEIIMHSPAKLRHVTASDHLVVLLNIHVEGFDLGTVTHEKILVSLTRNDYEPDVCFFRKEVAAQFTLDQIRFPAPDFVAEVLSPSTASFDRGLKKHDYAAHGVTEYWIIDAVAESVEQHLLRDHDYELAGVWTGADEITSRAIKGFRIPASALFERAAYKSAMRALMTHSPTD